MKTAGIIGGTGPESTIDYYRQIIALYREQKPDGTYPALIINCVDLKKITDWMAANALGPLADHLVAEIQKLARAGADFALISANTPHIVFDQVRRRSSIPLISIVEATCRAAQALGLKKLGLLGTRYTMSAGFFQKVFAEQGIALAVPSPDEQAWIHEKYMGELVPGIFLPETRAGLLKIVERLRREEKIEGLILGGTELPLILRDASCGIPLLDTTRIHVREIVAQMLA